LVKGIETSLDEILGGSGVTNSLCVNIIDTGELKEFLGDGSSDNTSTTGGGDKFDSD
jgi:hypothetical protein